MNIFMNFKLKQRYQSFNAVRLACVMIVSACALTRAQTFSYDFETDYQGWACDFADYNVGDSVRLRLSYQRDTLPQIRPVRYGIVMKGDNYSDDLFFFLKKHITGLSPDAAYTIAFSVEVVTNMPPDGIGGSDLMLKAGATITEPAKINSSNSYYTMNIDKANQSRPGPDMDTLGHVNHAVPGSFAYRCVTFTNTSHLFQRTADGSGSMWLVVGAESQFEVSAEFLVAKISATVTPLSTPIASKGVQTDDPAIVVRSKQGVSGTRSFTGAWGFHDWNAPVMFHMLNGKRLGSAPANGMLKHMPLGIVITRTGG